MTPATGRILRERRFPPDELAPTLSVIITEAGGGRYAACMTNANGTMLPESLSFHDELAGAERAADELEAVAGKAVAGGA